MSKIKDFSDIQAFLLLRQPYLFTRADITICQVSSICKHLFYNIVNQLFWGTFLTVPTEYQIDRFICWYVLVLTSILTSAFIITGPTYPHDIWWQFHWNCSRYLYFIWVGILLFQELQSSRPASFSPAGLTLWPSWLERWFATLSGLSVQVRIPVGLPGHYIGGSSTGLGKAQRINSSLRADWLKVSWGLGSEGESAYCYLLWDMACCLQWTEILEMYSSVPFPWAMWGWPEP